MATTFKDERGKEIGTRTNLFWFYPEELVLCPELNGRYKLPEIDTLVADMLSKPDGRSIKGQTTPCGIRKDGTRPTLVIGHRRYRAIQFINDNKLAPGGERLKVCCSVMQLTDAEALSVAITENTERKEIDAVDRAFCVKSFLRMQKDYVWIATLGGFFPGLKTTVDSKGKPTGELKKAIAQIKRWEKLLNLTEEARAKVSDGTITQTAAEHLSELEAKKQRELVAKGTTTIADIDKAAGKPEKFTLKAAREELDAIISDWATAKGVPKDLLDLLQKLRDRC